jgi:signal transduction histidine kinase
MDNLSKEITITVIASMFLIIVAVGIIILLLVYQKKQLYHFIEKENLKIDFQKQILQSQLEMQEQTFNTISQEIHDNVGQILSLAKVQLSIIDETTVSNKDLLIEAKENVSHAMSDLRDIAKSLSTDRIQQISLVQIVQHEADRINKSGIINVTVEVKGSIKDTTEQKKLILFRIIQESLQNTLKHANANTIDILFAFENDMLLIAINDNGKGFDSNKALQHKTGLGLQNIINRAALIGGVATINSEINQGTEITLHIPYTG